MIANKCPVCKGEIKLSTVTFTVDDGQSLVVIRNTPATVCSLCGEEWISDDMAGTLEMMVSEARQVASPIMSRFHIGRFVEGIVV